jgi:subtilisin family serine protease
MSPSRLVAKSVGRILVSLRHKITGRRTSKLNSRQPSPPRRPAATKTFAALAAAALIAAGLMSGLPAEASRKEVKVVEGGPAAVAAANDFRVLKPWEVAAVNSRDAGVAAEGDANSPPEVAVRLSDGQQFSFPLADGETATIAEGGAGVTTYVREGEGVTVRGAAPADPAEKIDARLKRLDRNDQSEVPVIIRLALSYKHFYDRSERGAASRQRKQQEFANAKGRVASLLAGAGRVKRDLLIINGVSASLKPAALDALAGDPAVLRVEPDVVARITLDTSVDEIRARQTWLLSDGANNPLTGVGQRIAIIDTGVDYTHPDLGGCIGPNCKVVDGWNFVAENSNALDDNGHGTHVAATAAGNGALKGVAPDARILAYKVCNSGGSCVSTDIIQAMDYATDPNRDGDWSDHVSVASMSLGGLGGNPDDAMSLAVDNSSAAGVVYTIAAGNSGPTASTIGSPGTARSAITVAAACKPEQIGVDSRCNTAIASFSSRGPLVWNGEDMQKPDVSAPGVMICAARWQNAFAGSPLCIDNQHIRISGTSMATPHVAGAAALVRQAYPGYDPAQVKQLLKGTARTLSRPADEQGAGMIDLSAAIPGSIKVTSSPNNWEMFTDASVRYTQFDNYFDVTPSDPAISTLDISANLPVPGVTMTFDKTTLNFAGQPSDYFFPTVVVDNNVTPTGNYSGSIVFKEGGVTKGIIPVYVHVAATVQIAPRPVVDYGLDNPSLATWTSDNRPVTVTNLRSDVSQTLNVAPASLPAGVTFNGPVSVTVAPESSVVVNTSYTVDNSVVPNGVYGNTLRVFSPTVEASVTTKFTKFFALTINDPAGADINGATAVLHDRVSTQTVFTVTSNPTTVYLDTAGPYDLVLYYLRRHDAQGSHDYTVYKEGISLASGAATVAPARAEAAHQLKFNGTDPSGAPAGPLGLRNTWDEYAGKSFGVIRTVTGASGGDTTLNYFSPVSSAYRHHEYYETRQAAPVLNYYYAGFNGLSSSLTVANTAADFKSVQLKVDLNRDTGTALPVVYTCLMTNFCVANLNTNFVLNVPVTQTVNSLLPPGAYLYQISDWNETGCTPGVACPSRVRTAYFDLAGNVRKMFPADAAGLPAWGDGTIYNGLGPSVFTAKFANTTNGMRLLPYTNSLLHAAFMRHDFSYQDYAAVPFVVTRNGSTVVTGSLSAVFGYGSFPILPAAGLSTPGAHEFRIDSFPYFNRGVALNAKVRATFDTTLADPNPPALVQLKYTTNGARSDAHDSAAANQLYFAMDAVGGTLAQASAAFSGDGTSFNPLALTPSGAGYTANVPAVPFTRLTLRVAGTDSSGNTLEYTFELPALNPVADTQAPTTAITSPANGQAVTSTVSVQAAASDNIGVTRVELYQDGSLIGTATAAPYSFSWNTDAASEGGHTLTTKAYDASNNVGTSAPVTVTVVHDNVPPAVALTAPAAGATLTGTVTVSADASDNRGVARVEFFRNGTLLGTDATAPYSVQWNTAAETPGGYTLTARAVDTSNNATVSAPRSVTVRDGIAPTAAINSPVNNSTVPRRTTVTISATASDNIGVTRVEFYVNNALTCTDTAAPYTCSWSVPNTKGVAYNLQARALDAAGNVGNSAVVRVTSQ